MSWLIDLAGKAEQYLDKIDHNTAVVLQNQKEKPLKDIFKYLAFIHYVCHRRTILNMTLIMICFVKNPCVGKRVHRNRK